MFCPKCGHEIADNINVQICPMCHTPLNTQAQPKKKKKGCLWALVAVVGIAVIGGVAGSSNGKKSEDESSQKAVVSTSAKEDEGKKASVKVGEQETGGAEEGEDVSETVEDVIYDQDGIKITYTGYEAKKLFTSASFNFLIENNSDKNITVENFNFNVNGYTLDTWFYESVPAGKKSNVKMDVSSSQLKENGIDSIGTVDFELKCFDSDTYDDLFITDTVSIIMDENAVTEESTEDMQLVYEGSGVQVYFKGMDKGEFYEDAAFRFLIINDSSQNVTVTADNIAVNDFAASDLFYADAAAGKKTNETLSIYNSVLEDNHIDKVEKLSFTMRCFDSDTYSELWQTDEITINVE